MTPEELREKLEAEGWKFGRQATQTGVGWYAWTRIQGLLNCEFNNKPPSFVLTPYHVTMQNGDAFSSVEFDLTGEVSGGKWLKLKAYSVPIDEAMAAIPECSHLLREAWNAAAQLAKGNLSA